jgi:hypothetical protein
MVLMVGRVSGDLAFGEIARVTRRAVRSAAAARHAMPRFMRGIQ